MAAGALTPMVLTIPETTPEMKALNLKIMKQDLLYFGEGGLLPGTHYVAQVVLKLTAILLPLSHKWIIGMSHHACLVISIQAALSFFRIESREEQGRA